MNAGWETGPEMDAFSDSPSINQSINQSSSLLASAR